MIQPNNIIISVGGMRTILRWNRVELNKINKNLSAAQAYIDAQCVEKMTPFVPVGLPRFQNSGKLRDSVQIKEPGCIIYTSPFAKHDYYSTVNHQHGGNPQGQRLWFEPMKRQHKGAILRGAAAIAGGRAG